MKVGHSLAFMPVNRLLKRSKKDFVMFTSNWCPFCTKAKNLLGAKKLSFEEHNLGNNQNLQMAVVQMTGQRTVPAIWDIRGDEPVFVGGADQLQVYL